MALLLWLAAIPAPRSGGGQDDKALLQAVEKLRSPESADRAAAEQTLRKAGTKAVPVLLRVLEDDQTGLKEKVAEHVKALSSPDWKKRDEAMRGIVKLGRHALRYLGDHENAADPEVAWRVKAAIAELEDRSGMEEKEEQARNAVLVRILGELEDPRAVPVLLRSLSATDFDLRLSAAESIAKVRDHLQPKQADEAAERVVELCRETKQDLYRCLLIKTLGALRSSVATPSLALLLRSKDERNSNVRRNAVAALAKIGDDAALRAVVESLSDDDVYVRHAALQQLEPLAGGAFGYDPRAADHEDALRKFRAWWEAKTGKSW